MSAFTNKSIVHTNPDRLVRASHAGAEAAMLLGDCVELLRRIPEGSVDLVFSSPPYCIGKAYEPGWNLTKFTELHAEVFPLLIRALKDGGSLCWQIGSHVKNGIVTPLDYLVYAEAAKHGTLVLRNRIVWAFGHGLHARARFSGRHETILWFTKGQDYDFDLDAVRVPQKYPGKTHSSGPKKGLPSGNPMGKNPGDIWEIPNVKANHVEKTDHPCQFPVALPQRFIKSLTKPGELICDPFAGSGSTGVAALLEGRRFVGADLNPKYVSIAADRLIDALNGQAEIRPLDRQIHVPRPTSKAARMPKGHFVFEGA